MLADAMLIVVRCTTLAGGAPPVGDLLTLVLYLAWYAPALPLLLPYSLPVLVPALAAAVLALRAVGRTPAVVRSAVRGPRS